jgi:hypothetical protein
VNDDYEISISRTPDGKLIVTDDPAVPLEPDCIVENPEGSSNTLFIHLSVIHNGRHVPVWFCVSEEAAQGNDLEKIIEERRPEIIEAVNRWESNDITE